MSRLSVTCANLPLADVPLAGVLSSGKTIDFSQASFARYHLRTIYQLPTTNIEVSWPKTFIAKHLSKRAAGEVSDQLCKGLSRSSRRLCSGTHQRLPRGFPDYNDINSKEYSENRKQY